MTRILIILLLLPALPACGKRATDAAPILERALTAVGGAEALAGVDSVYVRLEGAFRPPAAPDTKITYTQELLLTLPDRLAIRVEVAGIVTTKGVDGTKAWVRSGASVQDPEGPAAAEERADRDDLLSLLVRPLLDPAFVVRGAGDGVSAARPGEPARTIFFDPETGLPARIVRVARGAHGHTGNMVRTFSEWKEHGGIRFPSVLTVKLGGGRLDLTATVVEINTGDSRGLTHVRPRDEREIHTGTIERVHEPGGNYLAARQEGHYVNLAKVDVLIEQALASAYARRKGPNRRIFDRMLDESGHAVVTTLVPVQFDRDARARHLPRGVVVATLKEMEVLAMKFTGPYPLDDSLEKILVNYGRDLELEPAGPARYLVLSDPEVGAPADLRQEIRLPVRKAE